MKKLVNPTFSTTRPDPAANWWPRKAHSEVSSANCAVACSFDTISDMNVIRTICAKT